MVGNASDVFCFSLALDVGDISGNCTGENRIRVLSPLLETFSENDGFWAAKEILKNADERTNTVKERLSTGETLRLWYSEQPDEMCGLCWFASQYSKRNPQSRLYAVKLPSIEYDGQTLVRHSGWGGMPPGEWHKYLKYQEEPSIGFISALACQWKQLQNENAALRAVLNGVLHSVPEDFYDCFILREIAAENMEFNEARLIGNVLGKYRLGIGDGWIAGRIDKMLGKGLLTAVTFAPPGYPKYHRILKKTAKKF